VKIVVDHIFRPRLPWRLDTDLALTECGHDASQVKSITRDEYAQRVKDMGQQRAAMLTCMTCSQTALRWAAWHEDPRKAVGREIEWETGWRGHDRGQSLKDELEAIAILIESNESQFRSLLADIESKREWLAKKAAAAQKSKIPVRQKW